jgi:hypothetical protein
VAIVVLRARWYDDVAIVELQVRPSGSAVA